jgi:hypothetical protein
MVWQWNTVVPFWNYKSTAVYLRCASFWQKGHCRNQFETKWNCAWKSLEMDFRLFLWFVVFLDVV